MVPSVTMQLFLSVKEQQRKKWHNHCVMPTTTAVAFLPLYTFAAEVTKKQGVCRFASLLHSLLFIATYAGTLSQHVSNLLSLISVFLFYLPPVSRIPIRVNFD
jgi:hypothetical protein